VNNPRHESGGDRRTRDTGITLIEVVVSMSIMSVLMAVFTVGIVQMYRSANHNESLSTAQSQLNIAFLRLDKEIRYAAAVSTSGAVGSDFYVEYLTMNANTRRCSQLRLHAADRQLQLRTWTQGSPDGSATAWIPLASGVGAVSGQPPFAPDPDNASRFERLELTLVATYGPRDRPTSMSITFTALNSVRRQDGGTGAQPLPDQDVCGGRRP
jgi:prepilin-type N-terminal cleavage/methylation domain-containing protein